MKKEPENTVGPAGEKTSVSNLSCGAGTDRIDPGVPPKRAKGSPRPTGAGRKKGTPNRLTTIGRNFIIKKSMALPFLCDVSAG